MTTQTTQTTRTEAAETGEASDLARRLLALQERAKAIDEERRAVGARLAKIQATKCHDYEGVTVEVHPGRRTLDAKRFQQAYPLSDATAAYYKATPQPLSKLQQLVPGGVPDDCTKLGQPYVTATITGADDE